MNPDRSWMYNRNNPGRAGMIPEFAEGVTRFINHAKTLDDFLTSRLIRCPCVNCENVRYHTTETVAMHLMMNGFKPGYTVWTSHGEVESDTMFNNFVVGESSRSTEHNYFQGSRMSDMINDAFGMHSDFEQGENVEEAPNEEANIFYEQLRDCSSPLFNGSQHSKLSVAVRLLSIKSDNNISQGAMDSMIELMKELVDPNVEIPDSYYKANALVSKLGLSSIRIDCCEKGCMLYYKEDVNLESCKFCSHPRYKTGSTGKKLAIKAMHYLPLIPRLKRLYASNSSAPHMRWHRENRRPPGVMCHPSEERLGNILIELIQILLLNQGMLGWVCVRMVSPLFQLGLHHILVGLCLLHRIIFHLRCV